MKKTTLFLIAAFITLASFGQTTMIQVPSVKNAKTVSFDLPKAIQALHFSSDSVLTIDSLQLIKRVMIKDKPAFPSLSM